ncbi:MAG: hypothetical protein HC866_21855 [Leptolyngbyaceae cyanobacterium RU_5_1]|nr:hypothetical protein [Leptolyngbyaceae cyanobacterium RU_5_1]
MLAESTNRFPNQSDRDSALYCWLSDIQANPPAYAFAIEPRQGEYGFVLNSLVFNSVVLNSREQILFRSLDCYPQAHLAWQAASTFAEHLRYLNRYVSPAQTPTGDRYSLGIADPAGKLLAIAVTESDRLTTFQQLNPVEPFLQTDSVEDGRTAGYRFRLVDRQGATLLQGIRLYTDEHTTRDRFYQEILGSLFEPGVIVPTTSSDGFGFRILSRPRDRRSEAAIHPQVYASERDRDSAIERLLLLVRTARLTINVNQQDTAYLGQIDDGANHLLLQGTQRHATEAIAWTQGNILVELAQDDENFRLIDVDREPQNEHNTESTGEPQNKSNNNTNSDTSPFGWELTNEDKDQVLASHFYTSAAERDRAIETIQRWASDEGFHLLEHILLRPRTQLTTPIPGEPAPVVDGFLPIFVNAEDADLSEDDPARLTWFDPYSFWITIVLPYWPQRFRNINFRRFVERTLRLDAPAHVALRIAWVDVRQMRDFEKAYREWLEQLALDRCQTAACDLTGTLNRLLELLPQLRSVYPKATLYNCEESNPADPPILLNQTALGTAND